MEMEVQPTGAAGAVPSQRENELEEKLSKRTMLLALFIALSLAELLIVVELVRQTN